MMNAIDIEAMTSLESIKSDCKSQLIGGVAFDIENQLYFTCTLLGEIFRVENENIVSVFNHTELKQSKLLNKPTNILFNNDGNIFVSDKNVIQRVDKQGDIHTVSLLTSDSMKSETRRKPLFNDIRAMTLNSHDDSLIVADHFRLWKILNDGQTSLIAGTDKTGYIDGPCRRASFAFPSGLTFDSTTNRIYISDSNNQRIRMFGSTEQLVRTLAGSGKRGYVDGKAGFSRFSFPRGICCTSDGDLICSDQWNCKLRRIQPRERNVSLVNFDWSLMSDKDSNTLRCPTANAISIDNQQLAVVYNGRSIALLTPSSSGQSEDSKHERRTCSESPNQSEQEAQFGARAFSP